MKSLPEVPPFPQPARCEVELSQLDLRYEGFRMKPAALEDRLLSSLAQPGLQEPLEGVRVEAHYILLNGFKRYRCALKLKWHTVPFLLLGADELAAIIQLLRVAHTKSLALLEQARFVDELHNTRGLRVAEIAEQLSRSKAFVGLRLGLLAQMSSTVTGQILGME